MTIEERIESLEKSQGRWRRATLALTGVAAVAFISGALNAVPAELTVRRLTVVDENGSPCIILMRKSATNFTGIIMEQPHPDAVIKGGSIAISTSKDGASLRLGFGSDDENKESVSMVINRNGEKKLSFSDDKAEVQIP